MGYLKVISKDISRGMIILFIAILIVLPMAFLGGVLLFDANRAVIPDWYLIAGSIIWMLVFIGGMWLMIASVNRKRKRWLDSVFVPLGLTGRRYMLNWWEYKGVVDGREITARFYKGPTLEFSIQSNVPTRFVVTRKDQPELSWSHYFEKEPISIRSAELQNANIYGLDANWIRNLVEQPEVGASLWNLLNACESWALIRQVILAPGSLRLMLYRNKNLFEYDFNSIEAQQWLNDLQVVVNQAELEPRPQITAEPTKLEAAVRSGSAVKRGVLILIAFFLFIGACAGLTIWLLVRFAG